MRLSAFYADGVTLSRAVNPSILLVNEQGLPLRDELEFELLLNVRANSASGAG
jgi:hypothetical protein